MKLLSSDIEVAISSTVEVVMVLHLLIYNGNSILFYMQLNLNLISRFNNKDSLWSCGPWGTLSFTISWSFLLPCSWHQSRFASQVINNAKKSTFFPISAWEDQTPINSTNFLPKCRLFLFGSLMPLFLDSHILFLYKENWSMNTLTSILLQWNMLWKICFSTCYLHGTFLWDCWCRLSSPEVHGKQRVYYFRAYETRTLLSFLNRR